MQSTSTTASIPCAASQDGTYLDSSLPARQATCLRPALDVLLRLVRLMRLRNRRDCVARQRVRERVWVCRRKWKRWNSQSTVRTAELQQGRVGIRLAIRWRLRSVAKGIPDTSFCQVGRPDLVTHVQMVHAGAAVWLLRHLRGVKGIADEAIDLLVFAVLLDISSPAAADSFAVPVQVSLWPRQLYSLAGSLLFLSTICAKTNTIDWSCPIL